MFLNAQGFRDARTVKKLEWVFSGDTCAGERARSNSSDDEDDLPFW